MAATTLLLQVQTTDLVTGLPATATTFTLPLDASNPQAWADLLTFLLAHPELIMAFLQLLAMLLGGLSPKPEPPKPDPTPACP